MKDNFSKDSESYARFRPGYPDGLFGWLKEKSRKGKAWDCATGNGQFASRIAGFMQEVYATDISESQLSNAITGENIHYSIQPAESTGFTDQFFDLITVAQAVHWFNFDEFYSEVRRTAKPEALLVIAGYGKFEINREADRIIDRLYNDIIGKYWDPERKFIDEKYSTIPFPFREIESPVFSNRYNWNLTQLLGYLNTWSAVKHFEAAEGKNPVEMIANELLSLFGENAIPVNFPVLLRAGYV